MRGFRSPSLLARGSGLMLSVAALPAAADIQPRIVGGVPTTRDKYPWMVALTKASDPDLFDAQYCGGALIHPSWVVTAAHCVEGETTNSIDVVVGAHNLQTDPAASVRRIAIAEIIRHPAYDEESSDSDIALLRLASPVGDRPVLPVIDDPALCTPGTSATVLGWGTTSDGGDPSPVLREITIPIVSLATANATVVYDGSLTANMLPAGLAAGGKDSCQGDSGGPLIVAGPGTGVMLAGVVSFGEGCAEPNAYGVYTRVINFRKWLLGHALPSYAAWETATGAIGETRDPDDDGQDNWTEFLRGEPPWDGRRHYAESAGVEIVEGQRFGTFTFRKRTGPDIDTQVLFSSDRLVHWQVVNLDLRTVGTPTPVPGVAGLEERTVRVPVTASDGFFQIRAAVSGTSPKLPATLALGASVTGSLSALDPVVGGSYIKEFTLLDVPVGLGHVQLTLRSAAFDAVLSLHDGVSGAALQTSDGNTGGGTDEILEFLPTPAVSYRARVASATGPTAGAFTLSFSQPAGSSDFVLGVTTAGALATSDPTNPLAPGGLHYRDDYLLTNATPAQMVTLSLISAAFAPLIDVLDAASGQSVWRGSLEVGKSRVAFYAMPGRSYLIRVSSEGDGATGSYTLSGTSAAPLSLVVPQNRNGNLSNGDLPDPTYSPALYRKDDYLFAADSADPVIVEMTSVVLDCYLSIYDAASGELLEENDDISASNLDSRIVFTPLRGATYILRATSANESETGSYTVRIR